MKAWNKPSGMIRYCIDMQQANTAVIRKRHVISKIVKILTTWGICFQSSKKLPPNIACGGVSIHYKLCDIRGNPQGATYQIQRNDILQS